MAGCLRCFEAGPTKIYSQIVQNAIRGFSIDTSVGHYDTTSVSLSGNYEMASPLFKITYGHSKDKRPDLKQFMVSMLCVDRDIPIMGKTEDGNASDKKLNTTILGEVSAYMKKNGLALEAFVYVADSAMVTSENLSKAGDDIRFVTRLPSTYNQHSALQFKHFHDFFSWSFWSVYILVKSECVKEFELGMSKRPCQFSEIA